MPSAAISPSEAGPGPRLQRTEGEGRISLRQRDGRTVVEGLYQRGAAKIRMPRRAGAEAEAVLINTAGGLTGGDRFDIELAVGPGAGAVVATQACERIYRSLGGPARVSARIAVGTGGSLAWLPQETILFDRAELSRRIEADIAPGASLLLMEAVLFGRSARGERVCSGVLRDRWRIRCDGKLVFADDVVIEGPVADLLVRPAVAGGSGATATLLLVKPDAERYVDPVRSALGEAGGASAWDGKLVARLVAADGLALRGRLLPALAVLRDRRPPPLVWQL